jgi:hypothetical protein
MKKAKVTKKFNDLKKIGFTNEQMKIIKKLFLAQQKYINKEFNNDEKLLFDTNNFKKLILR